MAVQIPTIEELRSRVQADIDHFEGAVPERYVIAWRGYLAALLEWGLLSASDHWAIMDMLPAISEPDPVDEIMEGRNN